MKYTAVVKKMKTRNTNKECMNVMKGGRKATWKCVRT